MTIEQLYSIYRKHPNVTTDTRKITEGAIFFALKGPNFNANEFAKEALNKGAAYAVIDEPAFAKSENYIVVDDVLKSLQDLASYHRDQLGIRIFAIVGSNGKTTTKELLTSVLKQHFKVLATPGNFNNHIGLPLTLLQLNASHEIGIIEMGANHVGENAFLCEIAKPDMGLITNNGKDHLEGFGSIEGVAQSNSELYYYLLKHGGLAFVNANDEWLMRMASRLTRKILYAGNEGEKHEAANIVGIAMTLRPEIHFKFRFAGEESPEVVSALSGDYNFDNIMAAVAVGCELGMSFDEIAKGVQEYIPQNNRSQVLKQGMHTVFLDAYNANPSSLEAALRNFSALPDPHKIAIIGDMFELGEYADTEHANMVKYCSALGLEEVWLVGSLFSKHNVEKGMRQFETTDAAAEFLKSNPFGSAKTIFVKGSRGMKLETLVPFIV